MKLLIFNVPIFSACNNHIKNVNTHLDYKKIEVGQIWKYQNRPGEETSTITIWMISEWEDGDTIVHVRIDSLKIPNLNTIYGDSTSLIHVPISKKFLSESLTTKIGLTQKLPDTLLHFNTWKGTRNAGYWKNTLDEILNRIDSEIQRLEPYKTEIP